MSIEYGYCTKAVRESDMRTAEQMQATWARVQAGEATEAERAQYEQDKRAMWKASR